MPESRSTHRIHFDCLVDFEAGGIQHICELFDISLRGALIANCTGETPETGTPCKLTLSLDESREVQIIMLGTIARKTDNRVGIECKTIDIDSITHLRKLVAYNIGDPNLLERDLEALLQHD